VYSGRPPKPTDLLFIIHRSHHSTTGKKGEEISSIYGAKIVGRGCKGRGKNDIEK
jgi:hypothetical protein